MDKCNQVLDYASTHPNTTIHYHASDMILMTDTDSAYLDILEACSFISGYYYFTNRMIDYYKDNPTPNGPILAECEILKIVVSFSAHAEIGGTFENAKNVIQFRHILKTAYSNQKPTKVSTRVG